MWVIRVHYGTVSTVGIKLGSKRRHRIHNTSLLSSICSPSVVTSIEYTFFSCRISLRYLLASLSFLRFFFSFPCVLYVPTLFFIYISSCYLCPYFLYYLPQLLSVSKIVHWYRFEESAYMCIFLCCRQFLLVYDFVLLETISPENTSLIVCASFWHLPGLKSFFFFNHLFMNGARLFQL